MILQIRKLPTSTQHILQIAACLGNSFEVDLLSVFMPDTEVEEIEGCLSAAINAGLLSMAQVVKADNTPSPQKIATVTIYK